MNKGIEPGLVFSVPLSKAVFGFGQLITWQKPIFYMAAYGVRSESPNVDEEDVARSRPVLTGNFFDVLIRNGRWKPVGRLPIPQVAFPCFKIRIGDKFYVESWDRSRKREATPGDLAVLRPRTDYGPIILENALKAHFGIQPWDPTFDPLKVENVVSVSKMC
jgi:hypothetical protein